MKKNNSKNLIKTITVATLVFSVGTAFALNTAGAAGFDIMDKVVVDTVAEQETAQQVETRPNHALFVGYAPSSDPEITIATRISYGYSSHNAAAASRNIISYYYNLESLDDLLAVKAEGVNASGSSARTD